MTRTVIFLSACMRFKRVLPALVLVLMLGACASTATAPDKEDSEALQARIEAHLSAAGSLAELGEYDSALEAFLAAASLSGDVEIAADATRLAWRLKDWPRALAAADRWLELEPDSDPAHHAGIIARLNLGQARPAARLLAQWLDTRNTPASPVWWKEAAGLISAADAEEAGRETFELLARRHRRRAPSGEPAHARSILLWQQGAVEEALEQAEDAARLSGLTDHLVWAGQLALSAARKEQALDLFEQARAQSGQDHEQSVSLALSSAQILRQLGRTEDAIALLADEPENSEVLFARGVLLAGLNQTGEALKVWQQLRELDTTESGQALEDKALEEHRFRVARLSELVGEDEEAVRWYARLQPPVSAENRFRHAMALGRLGRLEESRPLLHALREEEGAEDELIVDSWLVEAEILREKGRYAEVIDLLSEPLLVYQDNAALLYSRALSAARADNLELAEQDLRRVIQDDPGDAMALNALGYLLSDRAGRHKEAYRLIRRALELDPDDVPTQDSMGWVLHKLGRHEEALPYLRAAMAQLDEAEIGAHLLAVLDALERTEEADALAARLLEAWPEDAYLLEVLESLGRLP